MWLSHVGYGRGGRLVAPGTGRVKVGIEFGKVQTEARWGDFDLTQLCRGCVFEALRMLRREEDTDAGGECDDNVSGFAV